MPKSLSKESPLRRVLDIDNATEVSLTNDSNDVDENAEISILVTQLPNPPALCGRSFARSQALQLLYQAEATGRAVENVLAGDYTLSEGPLEPYASELALGVEANQFEIDSALACAAQNWSLSRMSGTERNLLRIAVYEILYVDDVDASVAINECVELAKTYSTSDESSRFVNGVLGRVVSDTKQESE